MKKILLSLFVLLFGFISFGNCDQVLPTSTWNGNHVYDGIFDYYGETLYFDTVEKISFSYPDLSFVCFRKKYGAGDPTGDGMYSLDGVNRYNVFTHEIGCVPADSEIYFRGGNIIFSYFIYGDGYIQPLMTSESCQSEFDLMPTSDFNSLNCQTDFDLIPISSVDSAYCENNNLCSVYTGEISTGYSTLFINDIRHESMPFIYINIPEEFNRTYSTGINNFTIDVEGYNVDTDYISGIIQLQNSKPSQSDLNKLVSEVLPLFVPGLAVILLLYFIFRFIKKVF